MSQPNPFDNLQTQIKQIAGSYPRQLLGGVAALAGLLLLFSLLGYDAAGTAAPPFLTVLAGWTAPLLALAVLLVGAVVLFGRNAGDWGAEALVGAELLLLGVDRRSTRLNFSHLVISYAVCCLKKKKKDINHKLR